MKVCHIVHGIVGGGSEQVILNYAEKLKDDVQFELIYQFDPNPEIQSRFEKLGFKCHRVVAKTKNPLLHCLQIYRLLKENKYDAIHSHLDWYLNFYVSALALLAGIKKRIAHHHQAYHPKNLIVKITVFKLQVLNKIFATHYLACGNDAAISGWGKRCVKKGKVLVLQNAIDPARFAFNAKSRKQIREKLGIGDKYCIGHVGRFFSQKNHDFLIRVFNEIHKKNPNTALLLLGEGPLQEQIKNQVAALHLESAVIFAGLQKDTAPFYSTMDVFCLPSLWEGLPLVLIEAQYNGLPCLISSTITDEVKITSDLVYADIQNESEWIRGITDQKSRTDVQEKTAIHFDINYTYQQLQKVYFENRK